MQSHAGQPEIKTKLKPVLFLPGCLAAAMGAIVVVPPCSMHRERGAAVWLEPCFRCPSEAQVLALGSSHGLKVQQAWAQSELWCSAYKWHQCFLVKLGAY